MLRRLSDIKVRPSPPPGPGPVKSPAHGAEMAGPPLKAAGAPASQTPRWQDLAARLTPHLSVLTASGTPAAAPFVPPRRIAGDTHEPPGPAPGATP